MQVPKLEKIVINQGVGAAVTDKKIIDIALEELTMITGQKAVQTMSKKDISNFKLRRKMPIGVKVTLRRDTMYEFLDRLVSVALPRIRDFKGINTKFDGRGNYTLGITEQIIFPEIDIDKISKILGMEITFVTSANSMKKHLHYCVNLGYHLKILKRTSYMAKESLKAREVKRKKLVEKFAAKRAKLKAEGDFQDSAGTPEFKSHPFAQPLQAYRQTQGIYASVWHKQDCFQGTCFQGIDPRSKKSQLVISGESREKFKKMTDPIADYLTRLRNAISARHKVVEIPSSNLKKNLTKILFDKGYILNYKFVDDEIQGTIKIALKYHPETRQPAIRSLKRVSSPGLRKYVGSEDLPRVLNGLGIAIVSTSKGVMTDKEARNLNVGGEVLCYVY